MTSAVYDYGMTQDDPWRLDDPRMTLYVPGGHKDGKINSLNWFEAY